MRRSSRRIKKFYLERHEDASGVSGTGIVAVGVLLPSGKAVMEWLSKWKTITVFESIDQVRRIHGHGGRTVLRWGTPPTGKVRRSVTDQERKNSSFREAFARLLRFVDHESATKSQVGKNGVPASSYTDSLRDIRSLRSGK